MAVRRVLGAMQIGRAVKDVVEGNATPEEGVARVIEGGATAIGGAVVGKVVGKVVRNPAVQKKAKGTVRQVRGAIQGRIQQFKDGHGQG